MDSLDAQTCTPVPWEKKSVMLTSLRSMTNGQIDMDILYKTHPSFVGLLKKWLKNERFYEELLEKKTGVNQEYDPAVIRELCQFFDFFGIDTHFHEYVVENEIQQFYKRINITNVPRIHVGVTEVPDEKLENDTGFFYDLICTHPDLSDEFLSKHSALLPWWSMSAVAHFSEALIEKNIEKVDWKDLSSQPKLSREFLERHAVHLHWWYVFRENMNLTVDLIESRGPITWRMLKALCLNQHSPFAFFEKYEHLLSVECYCILSSHPGITVPFIEKNKRFLIWSVLCENPGVPESFFESLINGHESYLIGWVGLSRNTGLSVDFFERHLEQLSWLEIMSNTGLSDDFFERHIKQLVWSEIVSNTALSPAFFERNTAFMRLPDVSVVYMHRKMFAVWRKRRVQQLKESY